MLRAEAERTHSSLNTIVRRALNEHFEQSLRGTITGRVSPAALGWHAARLARAALTGPSLEITDWGPYDFLNRVAQTPHQLNRDAKANAHHSAYAP